MLKNRLASDQRRGSPCKLDNAQMSFTQGSRYPNRGGGLSIRTKRGSRYPNFLSFCSKTKTHGINKVTKNSKMAFSQLLR